MYPILKWLDDPQLVVRFQRFFGVHPTPAKETRNGDAHKSAHYNGTPCTGTVSSEETNKVNQKDHHNHLNGSTKSDRNMNCNEFSAVQQNGFACNGSACITQNGDASDVSVRKRIQKDQENNASKSKTSAWDIVSNQERGIIDKWETEEYTIKNKFLFYLFNLGACLGNEIFYITFYPFWLWNIDSFVGRRVCIFWAIFMYLGQLTKDLLKIPRPPSPPVIRMEKLYALEYGMPSTHAMVGAGFPFSILLLTWQRYVYPAEIALIAASLWTLLVCSSRLYLGMHSVLDVVAGLVYVFALMPLILPLMDSIDEFILDSPLSPLVIISIPLLLCVCYPKLQHWSTARGDTTVILAVATGVCLGTRVAYQLGLMKRVPVPPPYNVIYPDSDWLWKLLLRMIIGVLVVVLTRQIVKPVSFRAACYFTGRDTKQKDVYKHLSIELPYKFITYTAVAFVAVCVVPMLFKELGIERVTYFTEL